MAQYVQERTVPDQRSGRNHFKHRDIAFSRDKAVYFQSCFSQQSLKLRNSPLTAAGRIAIQRIPIP